MYQTKTTAKQNKPKQNKTKAKEQEYLEIIN